MLSVNHLGGLPLGLQPSTISGMTEFTSRLYSILSTSISQVIGWENWHFVQVKLLAGKIISKMTYNMLSGTLNPTLGLSVVLFSCKVVLVV